METQNNKQFQISPKNRTEMQPGQNFLVEVMNKSTQSESEKKLKNLQNFSSDENELKIEMESLSRKIEELSHENSILKTDLERQTQIVSSFKEEHKIITKDRDNLLNEVENLNQRIIQMQSRLDRELSVLLKELENEKIKFQAQQHKHEQQLANIRAPKICKRSFQDYNMKTMKRTATNMGRLITTSTVKDKMDNLKISISKQQQRPLAVSLSIQEFRDKQVLQGLKDKLEKTLIFPDIGKLKIQGQVQNTTIECGPSNTCKEVESPEYDTSNDNESFNSKLIDQDDNTQISKETNPDQIIQEEEQEQEQDEITVTSIDEDPTETNDTIFEQALAGTTTQSDADVDSKAESEDAAVERTEDTQEDMKDIK